MNICRTERLRLLREQNGLTQAELANALALSESHYNDLEQDAEEMLYTVSLEQIAGLIGILKCGYSDILELAGVTDARVASRSIEELRDPLRLRVRADPMFEVKLGWNITNFVAIGEPPYWNLDALVEVCKSLEEDWWEFLPRANTTFDASEEHRRRALALNNFTPN